jgi:ABC-type multidrug transport system fused ATPase/permease subunit
MRRINFRDNLFVSSLTGALSLLTKQERSKIKVVMLAMAGIIFVDLSGLALLLPVVTISTNISLIHSNTYLAHLYSFFSFPNTKLFLFCIYLSLLVLFVFRAFSSILLNKYISNFIFYIYYKITTASLDVNLAETLDFHSKNNASEMIRDIKINAYQYSRFIIFSLLTIISESIVFLIFTTAMIVYDAKLFLLVLLVVGPVAFLFYRKIKIRIRDLGKEESSLDGTVFENLLVSIYGYIDIAIYNKAHRFSDEYRRTSKNLAANLSASYTLNLVPAKIIELAAVTGVIAMLFYTVCTASSPAIIMTSVSIYIAASYRLMPSVNKTLNSFMLLKQYSHLFQTVKNTRAISENGRENSLTLAFNNSIILDAIHYSYTSDKKTIENISLTIPKGRTIGIIGRSGSGKTTLINLLLRFYKEDSGGIFVDGIKLTDENKAAWRKLIGYVKQDVFIMDGSIAQNISLEPEISYIDAEKLQYAIRVSSLFSFVESLPLKEKTRVGENGALLSGGQRQRIAIARALYHDSQVLIFDEATSALDGETEAEISESLNILGAEKKTIIIIAHRPSILKSCERIYQMENGQIIKSINYSELIHT